MRAAVSGEGYLRQKRDGVLLNLRVSPGAKATSIDGFYGDHALRMKVAAPPTRGRANAEIEEHLSNLLGVPGSQSRVVKGASSRDKVILLEGVGLAEIHARLAKRTRRT